MATLPNISPPTTAEESILSESRLGLGERLRNLSEQIQDGFQRAVGAVRERIPYRQDYLDEVEAKRIRDERYLSLPPQERETFRQEWNLAEAMAADTERAALNARVAAHHARQQRVGTEIEALREAARVSAAEASAQYQRTKPKNKFIRLLTDADMPAIAARRFDEERRPVQLQVEIRRAQALPLREEAEAAKQNAMRAMTAYNNARQTYWDAPAEGKKEAEAAMIAAGKPAMEARRTSELALKRVQAAESLLLKEEQRVAAINQAEARYLHGLEGARLEKVAKAKAISSRPTGRTVILSPSEYEQLEQLSQIQSDGALGLLRFELPRDLTRKAQSITKTHSMPVTRPVAWLSAAVRGKESFGTVKLLPNGKVKLSYTLSKQTPAEEQLMVRMVKQAKYDNHRFGVRSIEQAIETAAEQNALMNAEAASPVSIERKFQERFGAEQAAVNENRRLQRENWNAEIAAQWDNAHAINNAHDGIAAAIAREKALLKKQAKVRGILPEQCLQLRANYNAALRTELAEGHDYLARVLSQGTAAQHQMAMSATEFKALMENTGAKKSIAGLLGGSLRLDFKPDGEGTIRITQRSMGRLREPKQVATARIIGDGSQVLVQYPENEKLGRLLRQTRDAVYETRFADTRNYIQAWDKLQEARAAEGVARRDLWDARGAHKNTLEAEEAARLAHPPKPITLDVGGALASLNEKGHALAARISSTLHPATAGKSAPQAIAALEEQTVITMADVERKAASRFNLIRAFNENRWFRRVTVGTTLAAGLAGTPGVRQAAEREAGAAFCEAAVRTLSEGAAKGYSVEEMERGIQALAHVRTNPAPMMTEDAALTTRFIKPEKIETLPLTSREFTAVDTAAAKSDSIVAADTPASLPNAVPPAPMPIMPAAQETASLAPFQPFEPPAAVSSPQNTNGVPFTSYDTPVAVDAPLSRPSAPVTTGRTAAADTSSDSSRASADSVSGDSFATRVSNRAANATQTRPAAESTVASDNSGLKTAAVAGTTIAGVAGGGVAVNTVLTNDADERTGVSHPPQDEELALTKTTTSMGAQHTASHRHRGFLGSLIGVFHPGSTIGSKTGM